MYSLKLDAMAEALAFISPPELFPLPVEMGQKYSLDMAIHYIHHL